VHLVGFIIKEICHNAWSHEHKIRQCQKGKETYQYRYTKEKLYKTNVAIWYNKINFSMIYTIAECTVNELPMMDKGTFRNMQSFMPK